MSSPKWLPMESNPEVMNKFLKNMGVPEQWKISDIISFDEECLSKIPRPCLAVLFLFPKSTKYHEQCEKLKCEESEKHKEVFFMKQQITNSCGTVALIHAIANNVEFLKLSSDSCLQKFMEDTKGKNPQEIGLLLSNCKEIAAAHGASAEEGQTETPSEDEESKLHFITFVNVGSKLYELDGLKNSPICHGPTTADTFLQDACKICKEHMERDSDSHNFTALSFGAASG
ncbi:Ubiquitin carboxyl-terminal hydrolase isozyme L3, partial [Stegodyphus mimosarum]